METDRRILEKLAQDKTFNNPEYFQEIFHSKYPRLIEYKRETESWRKFYIRMIFYMSKLKEMNIQYSPTANPEKIYFQVTGKSPLFDLSKIPTLDLSKINNLRSSVNLQKERLVQTPVDVNFPTQEYEDDIIAHLKSKETKLKFNLSEEPSSYITNKKRKILVEWMIEVCQEYRLNDKTLHLSVNLFDRFISLVPNLIYSKIQIVGCACMLIASKFVETFGPDVGNFVYIADNSFTKEQLIETESTVLKTLNWEIAVPTSIDFLDYYLYKLALISKNDIRFTQISKNDQTQQLEKKTHSALNEILSSLTMYNFLPSLLAAASIFYMTGDWTQQMEQVTRYTREQVESAIPIFKPVE